MANLYFVAFLTVFMVSVYDINAIPSQMLACPIQCYCGYSRSNWEVDCSSRNLPLIPYIELDRGTYCLNMSYNRLTDLQPFPANLRIRTLWLSENNIVSIKKETFAKLQYLVDVNLENNKIKNIHPDAFVNSAGLLSLNLRGNPLGKVDGELLNARSLRNLDLSNTELYHITPLLFSKLTGLNKLDLSYNTLFTVKPNLLAPLSSLQWLSLNRCNLIKFRWDVLATLESLKILELADNPKISSVDWNIVLYKLKRLEILDLRETSVYRIPQSIEKRNKLKVLISQYY